MRALVVVLALAACARSYAHTVPFPGGIADVRGERAYVAAAAGGIEAIALPSGASGWRNAGVSHPLALAGGRLLALAAAPRPNELRFAVLDAADGKVVATSTGVMLPAWVTVKPAWAHTFDCQATIVGGRAIVTWRATAAWSQGMHPQEDQEAAARHDESGTLEVDLADARVRPTTPAPAAAPPPAPSPAGATLDGHHLLEPDGARAILVDAATHKRVATLTLPPGYRQPTVIGKRIYVAHDPEGLEAIELADSHVRWRHPLPRATPIPAPQ